MASGPAAQVVRRHNRGSLNRARVVDAAFSAWGRRFFLHMSLQLVAEELGVTKTALYRHVRSKDELVAAIEAELARSIAVAALEPLRAALDGKPQSLVELAELYIDSMSRYFDAHPYHYLYYMRRMMGQLSAGCQRGPIAEVWRERESLIAAHIQRLAPESGEQAARRIARYLVIATAFWGTDHYRSQLRRALARGVDFVPEAMTEREAVAMKETAVARFCHGFMPHALSTIPLAEVELVAWIARDELPEPDRIITAVGQLIEEIGYEATTIERIAEHTGLGKSSLYHHFRNKDEMLSNTILRDQRHLAELARRRFAQLHNNEERLYAIFVIGASFATHNAGYTAVERWLRESNIEVKIPLEHATEIQSIYGFMGEMILDDRLTGDPDEAFAILTFMNVVLVSILAGHRSTTIDDRTARSAAREAFCLFAGGAESVLNGTAARLLESGATPGTKGSSR